jgi:hypothetical protein
LVAAIIWSPLFFCLSVFRAAKSAREKDDKANQQNQTKPAAADDGAAKIKPAAAKQEQKDNQD